MYFFFFFFFRIIIKRNASYTRGDAYDSRSEITGKYESIQLENIAYKCTIMSRSVPLLGASKKSMEGKSDSVLL